MLNSVTYKYQVNLLIILIQFCFTFLLVATDSTASDDDTPPPLPAKARESDYTNLSDKESLGLSDYSSPIIINNIMVCNCV